MTLKNTAQSIAAHTRTILAARGLTLSDVARASRTLYRDHLHFHVPPNLYHALKQRSFSPNVQQLFVLSCLSGYRLVDWLAVFGVVLDEIPRLQATLPSRYTTLVDGNVYDDQSWVLSFRRAAPNLEPGSIRPLQEWLRIGPPRRYASGTVSAAADCVYAKIGCYDAFAFPDVLPGSIVRVAKHNLPDLPRPLAAPSGSIYLVEHGSGMACCRLCVPEWNRVVLCPSQLPFAHVELEIDRDVRIVGVVDLELRPTAHPICAKVSRSLARFSIPAPLGERSGELRLDHLLRRARRRSGLTFREASAKSALIARALGNDEFFCAAGSLSDYEAAQAPRNIQKMFSLCVLYSLSVWQYLRATGLDPSAAGQEAMPDELLGRPKPFRVGSTVAQGASRFPHSEAVAEFPYFVGRAAAELLKLPHLSIRDIFWVAAPRESFHPYLRNAIALIVDRRKKRIITYRESPLWAQPSYILLGRDGEYVCTSCGTDDRTLVIRPFSDGFKRPIRLRRPGEIEVVGMVVGVLRRFSGPE